MSSLSCVISPNIPSTFLKNAMISRLAASRSAFPGGPPPSSCRAMASYSRRSTATGVSAIMSLPEGHFLLRIEEFVRVQDDDRAAILHDEAGDVFRGEPLHDPRWRRHRLRRHLQHFGDRIDDHPDLAAIKLENDGASILAQRRGGAEALAQIDERDRGALILEHAFEKLRRLGQRRGRLVTQDALDLKDVEREVLPPHFERDQLDVVVAAAAAAARRHAIRSPSASRSRIGTRPPPSRSATPAAQGSVWPRGTGNGCSRTTASTSSTSNATWRPLAPSSTSTTVRTPPPPPAVE